MDTKGYRYRLPSRFQQDCELALMPIPGYATDPGLSVWPDISGNGRDATLVGPTWQLGPMGMELDFDGTDDALSCGTAISANQFTYAAIVKLADAGWNPSILKKLNEFSVYCNEHYIDSYVFESGAGWKETASVMSNLHFGKYALITVVGNGAKIENRAEKLQYAYSVQEAYTTIAPTANTMYIGSNDLASGWLKGRLTAALFWSRAFSEAEIKDFHDWIRSQWPPAYI